MPAFTDPQSPFRRVLGRNRATAGGTHLVLTALIATTAFFAIHFIWYPDALFDVAGGKELFLLLAGVDVVLGPLITFIIFVPGKKGLAFDLACIVTVQVAALAYGGWVLFESRPAYFVFVKDRFELVRALDIPDEELRRVRGGPFGALPVTGPRVAGARMPTDPVEVQRLTFAAASGVDLHFFPRYYVAYDEVRRDAVGFARPIGQLRSLNPGAGGQVDALVRAAGRPEAELAFLPMRAGKSDLAVIVDARNAEVLKFSALRPWTY